MRALSYILMLMFLLASCKARQELVRVEQTDSLLITERYVEEPVIVPGDSVRLSFPLIIRGERAVPSKAKVKGNRSELKVEVTPEGNIEAEAVCDEWEAKVKVLQRTVERYEKDVSVYREKESALQRTVRSLKSILKYGSLALVVFAALKYAKPVWTILKKLIK